MEIKHADDFESLYANNIRFESSVWDLKLLFGLLDQSDGKELVDLHTGISIPWTTAKLLVYFLRLNIMIHETENGKIRINPRVYPPQPGELEAEHANNAVAHKVRAAAIKLREEFLEEQEG